MNEGLLGIVRLAAVVVQNISFVIVIGALLCSRWLARGGSNWHARIARRLSATIRVASVVSLLASTLSFWAHCALMSDSTLLAAGPAVWSMIEATRFGHAWLAGALCGLWLVGLSLLRPPNEKRFPLAMWAAAAGVALARSHGGHPVEAGLFSLPVWVDWLHLLAISTWVGLVLVTAYIVMPRLLEARASERQTGASFVQSLSDASTLALLVLFGTGAYSGWRGVHAPADLVHSTYGQLLVLKLAFVFVAAALGGHNRFFEMPALLATLRDSAETASAKPLRRFGKVLQVESLVLLGVVGVAAVLVSSPLPGTT